MATILLITAEVGGEWMRALQGSGIDVLSARGLPEGVARVREGGIDLIVVDSNDDRPLKDFVHQLERLPDPPPFLLTSSSPAAPKLSAHLGAVDFLPKPCSSDELASAIERAIPTTTVPRTVEDMPTLPRERKRAATQ